MGKLTARQVETLKAPGRHADGGNLYLNIAKSGSKSFVFFYRFGTKQREMGLGSTATTSLAQARQKALSALKMLKEGLDPLVERRAAERAEASKVNFGKFADDYLQEHIGKFKNKAHRRQWEKTVQDYCASVRHVPLNELNTEKVLKLLRPMWQATPETGAKVRGRIEAIIDAAKAQGLYHGDNPARWKGHLKSVLPARQRLTRGHHSALPYDHMPSFMKALRSQTQSTAALALEFCILTLTRTNETIGAVWREFDLTKGIWTIPAKRMKAGHEHRIPLPARAIEILKVMGKVRQAGNEHVFPGALQRRQTIKGSATTQGKGLSNMAMAAVLKRMRRDDITVHGFRSTFRDWASEQTSFPHETCEHALAHRISDKAEAAYRRGDQFEKRRTLMDAWEAYCGGEAQGRIVKFRL